MKILKCDSCGKEEQVSQIVGTEFDYRGFTTLVPAYRRDGITDLCPACFKRLKDELHRARLSEEERDRKAVRTGWLSFLRGRG